MAPDSVLFLQITAKNNTTGGAKIVQKFLDAVRSDPRAKELIKAMPVPKDDQEAVQAYVKIAKELGFDLTADEIITGLKGMEEEQKAKSEKVLLDESSLEKVAGGAGDPRCADTFDKGEWCWFTDSCAYVITSYYDLPTQTVMLGTEGETPMPLPADEETGDTMYTELYKACGMTNVNQMRDARIDSGYFDS